MSFRELLQTEIWSKRTTRKIWIVVGTVLVVTGLWFEINHYWLTPPERKAAREALTKIDALEHSDGLSKEQFSARMVEATQAVEAASIATWTTRDRSTFELLSMYLDFAKQERSEQELKFPPRYAQFKDTLKGTTQMSKTVSIFISHTLHASLY